MKRQLKDYEGERDTGVYIRLTKAEKALLAEQATAAGLSQSDYIMELVKRDTGKKAKDAN